MKARTVPRFTVRECFPLKSDRDRRQLYEAFLSIWNAPENHRLLSFEPQSFSASEVSGWFDAHRTHYARFYCACDKSEELAGIAVVITKDSSNIEIYGLGVEPRLQGNGIGRLLLRRVIEDAKAEQMKSVCLIVYEDNAVMLNLVKSLGFTPVGKGANSRHDGTSTLRLSRRLKEEQSINETS